MKTKAMLKWKNRKIVQVLIILVSIILAFLIYGDTYYLSENPDKLEAAISKYIPEQKVKAEVALVYKDEDWMYVIFSDKQYGDCFMGFTLLKRGWNGRYVIRSAQYGSGPVVSMDIKPDNQKQVIIYGLVQDGRAVRYEYAKSVPDTFYEVMYKGNIDQEAFLHIQDNKGTWNTYFRLFNAKGEEITDSYLSRQRKDAPAGSTTTAEMFMVDVECILVLLFGLGLAVCVREKNKAKDWGKHNENPTG
jgi:hypothetical protein